MKPYHHPFFWLIIGLLLVMFATVWYDIIVLHAYPAAIKTGLADLVIYLVLLSRHFGIGGMT